MENLTLQEETIMRHIWHLGKATVKEVLHKCGEEAMPYTTLASIVKNLERKGYVKGERVGIGFRYSPVIAETDYKRSSLGQMVSHYFAGSYRQMVNFFIEEQKLSKEELEEIIQMLETKK